jgi:hypothetical protein
MTSELCKARIIDVTIESVEEAFEDQVSEPILGDLRKAEVDPKTIAEVKRQLRQTRSELLSLVVCHT